MTESSSTPRRRRPSVKKSARPTAPVTTTVDACNPPAETLPEQPATKATAVPAPPRKEAHAMMQVPIELRWRDLDAFNHVNNSSYLTYLEEARLRWLATIDGAWFFEDSLPVLASVGLNYRRPLPWPARIVVELSCERLGGSSMTIAHRIVDASDSGLLYCDGHVVMVWMNPATGTSTPLPEAIRKACGG